MKILCILETSSATNSHITEKGQTKIVPINIVLKCQHTVWTHPWVWVGRTIILWLKSNQPSVWYRWLDQCLVLTLWWSVGYRVVCHSRTTCRSSETTWWMVWIWLQKMTQGGSLVSFTLSTLHVYFYYDSICECIHLHKVLIIISLISDTPSIGGLRYTPVCLLKLYIKLYKPFKCSLHLLGTYILISLK